MSRIAVIGAGVIGASWTALFLANGHDVVVNDPRPDVADDVGRMVDHATPTLAALGLATDGMTERLTFEADLERAVDGVDGVQENGPERPNVKRELWARIAAVVPAHALLASSSSAITATAQGRDLADASRLLVGHPFNPPHLIPLVEVVPGERTSPQAVADAVAFYESLGKVPRVLHKEVRGFVANRLQQALLRECAYLVREGVVSIAELDDIVTGSIGLRWAADGPFHSFHLGGGPTGFRGFFTQFAEGMNAGWQAMPAVELDEHLQQLIVEQSEAAFGATPFAAQEASRDAKQLAIIRALQTAVTTTEETTDR
ncbi:MAG: 3-hydroxyacyl-CoA dehydrogenase NAD-binding domain-containing protein [Ilumatobacteraceae bacterium]